MEKVENEHNENAASQSFQNEFGRFFEIPEEDPNITKLKQLTNHYLRDNMQTMISSSSSLHKLEKTNENENSDLVDFFFKQLPSNDQIRQRFSEMFEKQKDEIANKDIGGSYLDHLVESRTRFVDDEGFERLFEYKVLPAALRKVFDKYICNHLDAKQLAFAFVIFEGNEFECEIHVSRHLESFQCKFDYFISTSSSQGYIHVMKLILLLTLMKLKFKELKFKEKQHDCDMFQECVETIIGVKIPFQITSGIFQDAILLFHSNNKNNYHNYIDTETYGISSKCNFLCEHCDHFHPMEDFATMQQSPFTERYLWEQEGININDDDCLMQHQENDYDQDDLQQQKEQHDQSAKMKLDEPESTLYLQETKQVKETSHQQQASIGPFNWVMGYGRNARNYLMALPGRVKRYVLGLPSRMIFAVLRYLVTYRYQYQQKSLSSPKTNVNKRGCRQYCVDHFRKVRKLNREIFDAASNDSCSIDYKVEFFLH